jgi:PPOX class probable F420-dependent enzyme
VIAPIPDVARGWFEAAEFATVATIEPDGRPQQSVVWVRLDGADVLFSTIEGRRKHTNLMADPRMSVLVSPASDPYRYCEVRGTATMTREGGRELIDEFERKYHGRDRYTGDDGTDNVRVVVRVTPVRVVLHCRTAHDTGGTA